MQIVAISFLYPSSGKFIFTKATKCVVQRDSSLKKNDNCCFFSPKIGYKDETWCILDPCLVLSGVFIATFSLLKRSKSVYLTFIQCNSHFYIMSTSVSLFSCHMLTKKQKLYRS